MACDFRQRDLPAIARININLWWGAILLAFGVVMFWLGRRGTSSVQPADDTAEGRKLEQREASVEATGRGKRGGH